MAINQLLLVELFTVNCLVANRCSVEFFSCRQTLPNNESALLCITPSTGMVPDPETSVQLYQVHVVPTLVYGLELILPEQRFVDSLERTNKKFLKHILSLC